MDGSRFCPQCGTVVAADAQNMTALRTEPNAPDEIIVEEKAQATPQVQSLIPLTDGEEILWHRELTRGMIHKEAYAEEAVTNKRCVKYDVEKKQMTAQVGITHRPEVVVMNIHRINDSLGGGVFLSPRLFGLPGLGGVGVYGGPRRGNLKIYGDASIMCDGKKVMTFENIEHPMGLRQLIEVLKREAGVGRFNMRSGLRQWQKLG